MKKEEARDEMNGDAGSLKLRLLVVVLQWLLLNESRNRADGGFGGREVSRSWLAGQRESESKRPIARP